MTKPTPEQLLELAKIVEPDKEWVLDCGEVFSVYVKEYEDEFGKCFSHKHKDVFNPLDNDAQLMKVVFALWDKMSPKFIGNRLQRALNPVPKMEGNDVPTYREAIVNLAIEVLT